MNFNSVLIQTPPSTPLYLKIEKKQNKKKQQIKKTVEFEKLQKNIYVCLLFPIWKKKQTKKMAIKTID